MGKIEIKSGGINSLVFIQVVEILRRVDKTKNIEVQVHRSNLEDINK